MYPVTVISSSYHTNDHQNVRESPTWSLTFIIPGSSTRAYRSIAPLNKVRDTGPNFCVLTLELGASSLGLSSPYRPMSLSCYFPSLVSLSHPFCSAEPAQSHCTSARWSDMLVPRPQSHVLRLQPTVHIVRCDPSILPNASSHQGRGTLWVALLPGVGIWDVPPQPAFPQLAIRSSSYLLQQLAEDCTPGGG